MMLERANTAAEKRAIIERLYAQWLASPDLRLGQLLFNAAFPDDIFYIEDYPLIRKLEDR